MKGTLVVHYLTLRKTVGLIGIAFPILLVLGSVIAGDCNEIQSSISEYYHTTMRDIFVGTLCIVAFFLFAYKGYEKKDRVAGYLGCFFALGIAFFPTGPQLPPTSCAIAPVTLNPLISVLHYLFAISFFFTLSYYCLCLFPKSNGNLTPEKKQRNKLYRICGYIMLVCNTLLIIYFLFFQGSFLSWYKPIFFLEGIALWAFGLSWLVKGETLLKDKVYVDATNKSPSSPFKCRF